MRGCPAQVKQEDGAGVETTPFREMFEHAEATQAAEKPRRQRAGEEDRREPKSSHEEEPGAAPAAVETPLVIPREQPLRCELQAEVLKCLRTLQAAGQPAAPPMVRDAPLVLEISIEDVTAATEFHAAPEPALALTAAPSPAPAATPAPAAPEAAEPQATEAAPGPPRIAPHGKDERPEEHREKDLREGQTQTPAPRAAPPREGATMPQAEVPLLKPDTPAPSAGARPVTPSREARVDLVQQQKEAYAVQAPRELSFQVKNDLGETVWLRFSQSGGQVNARILSADAQLAGKLRENVSELISNVERTGVQAQASIPGGGPERPSPQSGQEDRWGQHHPAWDEGRRRQEQEQRRRPPRGMEAGLLEGEFSSYVNHN